MSKKRLRWLGLGACLWLTHCGTNGPSGSEQVAQRHAKVALPPQVSPGFAVDDPEPTTNLDATLLNVTGSSAGGYLLTYSVNLSAAVWSRREFEFDLGILSPQVHELVFV